jgi:tRNA(Ile)-lysidine synthase TilS/MesJ
VSEPKIQLRIDVDLRKLSDRLCENCRKVLRDLIEEDAKKKVADLLLGGER